MNAGPSAARLPEPVRKLIEAEPPAAGFIARGMDLGDVLSSPDWAAAWTSGADPLLKGMLRWMLLRYGALPFEEEKTEAEAVREGTFTGAEWRVGLMRLRRAGILFAIRKTWGDRLYYIPADMVPVWQGLLTPVHPVPLGKDEAASVRSTATPFRLPLSLELLSVWALIRRGGIPLTVKGAFPKPAAARLISSMRLTSEELAPLKLNYPHHDQLPAAAALAIDLGLRTGMLRRREREIAVSGDGGQAWVKRSVTCADAGLHRLVVERYVSPDPALHLAASVVASCEEAAWYREADILHTGVEGASVNIWLGLLVSFGWAERGLSGAERVFRLLTPLRERPAGRDEEERFVVQPDGEIFVPPGVSLAARWKLEEIAERSASDRMFVYRLTRAAAAAAYRAGWNRQAVADFLERGSGDVLPGQVADALADWFGSLGKVSLQEAVLLRTDSAETAAKLRDDPEIGARLAEAVGNRDFVIDRSNVKAVAARLEKIGMPVSPADAGKEGPSTPEETDAGGTETGWIHGGNVLSIYEPDRSLASAKDLFPGLAQIPPAWLSRPRTYHASTRLELIRKAIGWRTSVRIGYGPDARKLFVPQSVQLRGEEWEVSGRWHTPDEPADATTPGSGETVILTPERLGELMIVLPDGDDVFPQHTAEY